MKASGAVPVSLYGGFRFVSVTPEITEVIIILNIDPKVRLPSMKYLLDMLQFLFLGPNLFIYLGGYSQGSSKLRRYQFLLFDCAIYEEAGATNI